MQPVLQIDRQGMPGTVSPQRTLYIKADAIHRDACIVQGQQACRTLQLHIGIQFRSDTVYQQLPVLPENDVVVLESYRQARPLLVQRGTQRKRSIPQTGIHPRVTVIESDIGTFQRHFPYIDASRQGTHRIRSHRIGRRLHRCRIRLQDVPVRHTFLILIGINGGIFHTQVIHRNLVLIEIVQRIHHHYALSERKERIGLFPYRIGYGFRYQAALRQLQPKTGERGEKSQLHALHIQLGIHGLVGNLQHDRSQLLRREYKINGESYDAQHHHDKRHKRKAGHFEDFLCTLFHDCLFSQHKPPQR